MYGVRNHSEWVMAMTISFGRCIGMRKQEKPTQQQT